MAAILSYNYLFRVFMKKLFGTDGMRGEAGTFPLDEKTIEVTGWSLARQFREKLGREARFITGRDTCESGVWIEKAFHAYQIIFS